jgi:hypothetical protein
MKRVKAWVIIILGTVGFVIMPSDSVLQAAIGLGMIMLSIALGNRNWRAITRELIKFNHLIGMESDKSEKEGR